MSLITERLLIKPGMSFKDEKALGNADIVYGLAGTLVLVSGSTSTPAHPCPPTHPDMHF